MFFAETVDSNLTVNNVQKNDCEKHSIPFGKVGLKGIPHIVSIHFAKKSLSEVSSLVEIEKKKITIKLDNLETPK